MDELERHFRNLDRSYFMDFDKHLADIDAAFSIGYGQTISQPSLVLMMTRLLEPDKGLKALEIGTGSGYQTAMLSPFFTHIWTVERIPELHKRAKKRLLKAGYKNITFIYGDGNDGFIEGAPYDRIMVTAAALRIPEKLFDQLAIGGIMVVPVGGMSYQELLVVKKGENGEKNIDVAGYVRFVPLVGG